MGSPTANQNSGMSRPKPPTNHRSRTVGAQTLPELPKFSNNLNENLSESCNDNTDNNCADKDTYHDEFVEFRLGGRTETTGIVGGSESNKKEMEIVHYSHNNKSVSSIGSSIKQTNKFGPSSSMYLPSSASIQKCNSPNSSSIPISSSSLDLPFPSSSRGSEKNQERATSLISTPESQTTNGNTFPVLQNADTQKDPKEKQQKTQVADKIIATSESNDFKDNETKEIKSDTDTDTDDDWEEMPTVATYDIFDYKGKLVVEKEENNNDSIVDKEASAAHGYTRVAADMEENKLTTEIGEHTEFLFDNEEGETRNTTDQLHVTKEMLTDDEKIAYVGLTKVAIVELATELAQLHGSRNISKKMARSFSEMAHWSKIIMDRLYNHMGLTPEEQQMVEKLSAHGIEPSDLAKYLKKTSHVKNPLHVAQIEGKDESNDRDKHSPDSNSDLDSIFSDVVRPERIEDREMIDLDVKWTALCDLFLILIGDAVYDARSRTLLKIVGESLGISKLETMEFERRVTNSLEVNDTTEQTWDESIHMHIRKKKSLKKKYMYVGLATLGGGLVLGLSAGLLAPVIGLGLAAGFSTIGIAGTSTFLTGAGGAAIVTTTAAAIGAKIGGQGMTKRMGDVKTFEFIPFHNNKRLNVILTISGWMLGKEDDVRLPFSTVDPVMGDLYSLIWEPEILQSMGQTINILATEVLTQSVQQVLGQTVLTVLMAGLQWPMALSKLGYILDNPWNVSLDRAWKAGLLLADTLMSRNLGVRPVTLVGFSIGVRVIYSCLVELAKKGAYGLVEDVYFFGAPVVIKKDQFILAKSVVSGRFVNGYSSKDWILGYLFRATSGGLARVAGLAPVEGIHGVENFDCTSYVNGHMGYRKAMPKILKELGWNILSEEFGEIEDPDPDRYEQRQRELIVEFDEARKQMEEEISKKENAGKKKSVWDWMKRPKKKDWWEMYQIDEDATKKGTDTNPSNSKSPESSSSGRNSETVGNGESITLFDIDELKNESSMKNKEEPPVSSGAQLHLQEDEEDYFDDYSVQGSSKDGSISMGFAPDNDSPASFKSECDILPPSSNRVLKDITVPVRTRSNSSKNQFQSSVPRRIETFNTPISLDSPYSHNFNGIRRSSIQMSAKGESSLPHDTSNHINTTRSSKTRSRQSSLVSSRSSLDMMQTQVPINLGKSSRFPSLKSPIENKILPSTPHQQEYSTNETFTPDNELKTPISDPPTSNYKTPHSKDSSETPNKLASFKEVSNYYDDYDDEFENTGENITMTFA